jgi:flavin-dependent dehydrogenase
MSTADRVDVLIVGGGPAGSTTALALRIAGISTIIIERSQHEAVRVGESLPPAIKTLLIPLGIWEEFRATNPSPSYSIRSAWGAAEFHEHIRIYDAYGDGWHIDRRRFDALMFDAAERAGAIAIRGSRIQSWGRDDSGAWAFELLTPRGTQPVRARYLVDATGRASSYARRLGARRLAHDRLVGLAGFLKRSPDGRGPEPCLLLEAAPDGWWYSAPLPDSTVVAMYMTDADLLPRGRNAVASVWQEQLEHAPHTRARLIDWSLKQPIRAAPAQTSRLDRPCGDEWIAVGDAASSFDPLSGQGLYQAIRSGMLAAGRIQQLLTGVPREPSYRTAIETTFGHYLRSRDRFYGSEQRWTNSEFWQRRHLPTNDLGRGRVPVSISSGAVGL